MSTPSAIASPPSRMEARSLSFRADISLDGIIRDVTPAGAAAWGWAPGDVIPEHLRMSLEPILPGDTADLPFVEGGLQLRVESVEGGWRLTGRSERDDRRATDSSEARNAFIGTLSHELRTPLGSINGFTNLLRREIDDIESRSGITLPEQLREFADVIAAESGRLLSVVNDLFDHANLESGSLRSGNPDIRRGTTDLGTHVASALERVRPELDRKGVRLVADRIGSGLIVQADPGRVDRILDGLLSNATKFTHEGSVTVSSRMDGSAAVLEITDTGIGISESYQANLFEAFSQEENWRSRMHGGAGLGLALVSRTLDLMGGWISVSSRKGCGSTFNVGIPLAESTTEGDGLARAGASAAPAFNRGRSVGHVPGGHHYAAHFRVHTERSV